MGFLDLHPLFAASLTRLVRVLLYGIISLIISGILAWTTGVEAATLGPAVLVPLTAILTAVDKYIRERKATDYYFYLTPDGKAYLEQKPREPIIGGDQSETNTNWEFPFV